MSHILVPSLFVFLSIPTFAKENGKINKPETSVKIKVGDFSGLDKSIINKQWQSLKFPNIKKLTRYRLVKVNINGVSTQVVKAKTEGGASGWIRKLNVDPAKYPILTWSWKVSGIYKKGNMLEKKGDDYPARLYVVFKYEPARASWTEKLTRGMAKLLYGKAPPGSSINYLWANRYPAGKTVPSAFTNSAMMVAVEGGEKYVGKWRHYRRNIYQDYQRLFGYKPPPVVGIAIMTDGDNTGSSMTSWYGDISLHALK